MVLFRITENELSKMHNVRPYVYSRPWWDVHNVTLADGSRTNNICEGWNSSFAKPFGSSHPHLYKLMSFLKKRPFDSWQQLVTKFQRHTTSLSAPSGICCAAEEIKKPMPAVPTRCLEQ